MVMTMEIDEEAFNILVPSPCVCVVMLEIFVEVAMEAVERKCSTAAARMDVYLSLGSSLHYICLGGSSLVPNTSQMT
jgi:hypothetical protein